MANLVNLPTHQSPTRSLILIITSTALLWYLGSAFRRAYLTPLRALPGPWYAKWTRLWLKWKIISGQRTQYIDRLHQIYGPYIRIAPDEVSTSDLSAHVKIHGAGSKFCKSDWYNKFTMADGPHDSPGIFAITDPKVHSERRKLFSHAFSNTSIMTKESTIRSKINMAVDKFIKEARIGGKADMMKWWTFLASDVMAALSFGKSFELLEREEKTRYIRDMETVMMVTGIRAEFMTLFNIVRRIPLNFIQDTLRMRERIDEYGATAIQNHKKVVSENPEASTSLFARFLDPSRHKSELTDYQLAQEAGNLIVAGSDTTSIALTYLTYALLRPCNKPVLHKLMQEISTLALDAPAIEIMALPYLKQTIEESLRLYNGTSSLPRAVPASGTQMGGYFFPAGTTISTQSYTLMRDPKTFTDPLSFTPERWNSSSTDMKSAYSPFLMGARGCLGIHLAMLEISCAIFTFLKKCPSAQIAPTMKDEDMDILSFFILVPKGHRLELTLDG